ncbi:MAG: 4-(cytidine 5'-diphospho)-2-C-methyl-D-erythritol kinase, partial [Candidatus Sumerlaeia bacterium]|nr:4-(cytidine 5'-diphospho)-2-C-methyl-D-erythritol kinase [Candidatus Sumerlaeia bacterium]
LLTAPMLVRQIASPAKINLHLDILNRRADGFHDLDTIFLAIDLADRLSISAPSQDPRPGEEPLVASFEVTGPHGAGVPTTAENLIWRAFQLFEEETGRRLPSLKVHLHKNIPHGAGLGGGSSNAAAALHLANKISGIRLGIGELEVLAARLGSDCAFFIRGGAARGTGRGEVLTPLPVPELPLLLVVPDFSISTAHAYGSLRPDHLGRRTDCDRVLTWMQQGGTPPPLYNSFEDALHGDHPTLADIRRFLTNNGALTARLSGSGSATFAIFPDLTTRDAAHEGLPGQWKGIACQTLPPVSLSIHRTRQTLPAGYTPEKLARLLHEWMAPHQDTPEDTLRGVEDVLARGEKDEEGAFLLLATRANRVVGILAMMPTGMSGYVPANLLLYLAVDPRCRGQGIGGTLVEEALDHVRGDVKLHLEKGNPARSLYKRLGFRAKYEDFRLIRGTPQIRED